MDVNELAHSFTAGDGTVSVLFCHGFTASPASLRDWAEATAAAGYRVSVPRLPGHGTSWQELNATSWRDWYHCVDREFKRLRRASRQVFVAGLSMGGSLALRLAEKHPNSVAGLILVNPAVCGYPKMAGVPLVKHLLPSVGSIGSDIAKPGIVEPSYSRTPLRAAHSMMRMWGEIRSTLDLIHCPLLLFRSATDHVVPAMSSEIVLRQVSSEEITERVLHNSFHVATMDNDAPQLFAETIEFLDRHSSS